MVITGLCGTKKKEQVPTTLRRGRQLKTRQESPELWKAEHESHHTGYCTNDVKNIALRKEGWVSYWTFLQPKRFSEEEHVANFRSEKSMLILSLFNSFALPSFENKSGLFSRSWNLGRCIWIPHSCNPVFLQVGNKQTLKKKAHQVSRRTWWTTLFPDQDINHIWNVTAKKCYSVAARENHVLKKIQRASAIAWLCSDHTPAQALSILFATVAPSKRSGERHGKRIAGNELEHAEKQSTMLIIS